MKLDKGNVFSGGENCCKRDSLNLSKGGGLLSSSPVMANE